MPSLTIFANFFINSDERYLRMVDSFNSMSKISASKWVINARGIHAKKTIAFLSSKLDDKLISFNLESKQGWLHDTKQMLSVIETDYIFFWLEDHINMVDTKKYSAILGEMKESGSEYLEYSWWHKGQPLRTFSEVIEKELPNIFIFTNTEDTLAKIGQDNSPFIISMVGIFSNSIFKKIITETPLFLRQYPKMTPFNFEKGAGCKSWLPIKMAIPKEELFANIDDDHSDPGYSLQSRGLYPVRERRESNIQVTSDVKKDNFLKRILPKIIYKKIIKLVIVANLVKNYISLVVAGK